MTLFDSETSANVVGKFQLLENIPRDKHIALDSGKWLPQKALPTNNKRIVTVNGKGNSIIYFITLDQILDASETQEGNEQLRVQRYLVLLLFVLIFVLIGLSVITCSQPELRMPQCQSVGLLLFIAYLAAAAVAMCNYFYEKVLTDNKIV